MTDRDDSLGSLLSSVSRRAKRGGPSPAQETAQKATPESARAKGLNPMDLLALPPEQRELVNWLSRKKQASFEDLVEGLGKPASEIEATLEALKSCGYVQVILTNGLIQYRVLFSGTIRRSGRGLPTGLWSRLDQDPLTFLRGQALFQGLPDDALRAITSLSEAQHYSRDQVIVWQGSGLDRVHLIKNGVIGMSRLSPGNQAKILEYLKPGDLLGEVSALSERSRTAAFTATALSEVDTLVFRPDEFLNLLMSHGQIALGLARRLAQRLDASDTLEEPAGSRLCLVVGADPGSGATVLGTALAMLWAKSSASPTVYAEYPNPDRLLRLVGLGPVTRTFSHPGGYDIYFPQDEPGLPLATRGALLVDQLLERYSNVVIGLTDRVDEIIGYTARRANHIVLISTPAESSWKKLGDMTVRLRTQFHPIKTGLSVVLNRTRAEWEAMSSPGNADFDFPFDGGLPEFAQQHPGNLPESWLRPLRALIERLGRTNQISVYIPTTINVDGSADTTSYVEKTRAFLGQLFGGATSNQAQGVWNSEKSGLVDETIYIVRSYVTQADMDEHLTEVLGFAAELKQMLQQEAVAVEVNQEMVLI